MFVTIVSRQNGTKKPWNFLAVTWTYNILTGQYLENCNTSFTLQAFNPTILGIGQMSLSFNYRLTSIYKFVLQGSTVPLLGAHRSCSEFPPLKFLPLFTASHNLFCALSASKALNVCLRPCPSISVTFHR